MNLESLIAEENLLALEQNPYPGRGIIVGLDESETYLVQVYWIMGRSENSRNRLFILEGDMIKTTPADPKKVKDPSLIIYTAMANSDPQKRFVIHAVSNGHQTTDALQDGDLEQSIAEWEYEPDSPNFTPRITAICKLHPGFDPEVEMAVFKKSPISSKCDRYFYNPKLNPGVGYCITTYLADGDPLPSFEGEPYVLPLEGNIEDILHTIWNSLNEENRISLVVKFIDIEKGTSIFRIINKYDSLD